MAPKFGSSSTNKIFLLFTSIFFTYLSFYFTLIYKWKFHYKSTSFSFLTFYVNLTVVVIYDLFYIRQTQTVSFYIVQVTGMFAVKLIKYFFGCRLAHSGSLVFDSDNNSVFYIFGININYRHLWRIFNSVVQNIDKHTCKMRWVNQNRITLCFKMTVKTSVAVFNQKRNVFHCIFENSRQLCFLFLKINFFFL